MDKRTAICNYLEKHCIGRENAIFSSELEELFCTNGRGIRRYINSLRRDGFPICSDEKGYYYAESQKEIDETIKRLNSQMINMSGARNGMLYASIVVPAIDDLVIHITTNPKKEENNDEN